MAASDVFIGQTISHYRILKKLGSGKNPLRVHGNDIYLLDRERAIETFAVQNPRSAEHSQYCEKRYTYDGAQASLLTVLSQESNLQLQYLICKRLATSC